jgi:hypothetical protein
MSYNNKKLNALSIGFVTSVASGNKILENIEYKNIIEGFILKDIVGGLRLPKVLKNMI